MADEPQEKALVAEWERLFGWNRLVLEGLMATASPALRELYQTRMNALKKQTAEAEQYLKTLPEDQRLKWWLSHLERMNQELGALIRQMRAAQE